MPERAAKRPVVNKHTQTWRLDIPTPSSNAR